MIKFLKIALFSTALISTLSANENLSTKQINEIENLFLFQKAQVKINSGIDAGSVYMLNVTVRGKGSQIFLTKDKKYLIPGDVISTQDGKPLTMPVDLKPTIGKEAFTYGTGKDEYVLFTDPECPYCKKFESYFPQMKDKVKIRVFYFPLDFHKNAKDISLYILSKKTNDEKIKVMETTKDTHAFKNRKYADGELAKLEKQLNEQINLGNQLGVSGTPALFDKNGAKVSWVELLQKNGIQVK
jgi:thiol:disulfide interchange protein DsbC